MLVLAGFNWRNKTSRRLYIQAYRHIYCSCVCVHTHIHAHTQIWGLAYTIGLVKQI